jgi:hypothetical protein
MISKISAFTYSCTLYTKNSFAWNIMIVDSYSGYQKLKTQLSPMRFDPRTSRIGSHGSTIRAKGDLH